MAVKNEDKVNFIFSTSKGIDKLNMNELLKDSIKLVDGKGGGSKVLAQGAGKNNGNIDSMFDYVSMKISNLLK
ncbi:DHHA1 domain-containing protein [Paraclostridium sp. AKS73]